MALYPDEVAYHPGIGPEEQRVSHRPSLGQDCTVEPPATTHQQLHNSMNRMDIVIDDLNVLLADMRGEGTNPTSAHDVTPPPPMLEVYKGASARISDQVDRLGIMIDNLRGDLLR